MAGASDEVDGGGWGEGGGTWAWLGGTGGV